MLSSPPTTGPGLLFLRVEHGRVSFANQLAVDVLSTPGQVLLCSTLSERAGEVAIASLLRAAETAKHGTVEHVTLTLPAFDGISSPWEAFVFPCLGEDCWSVLAAIRNSALSPTDTMLLDMPWAVMEGEFRAYFQPVVTSAGELLGCEALIRWHRDDGIVSPADFIDAAEQNGFILELGQLMLHQALAQIQRFDAAGHPHLYVSVNLSPRQLEDPNFEAQLARALSAHDVGPSRLLLEITENLPLVGVPEAGLTLRRIAATGVRIVLDDYGTGFAGLHTLKQFPVSVIKIDRVFVEDVCHSEVSDAILQAIVALASVLGLRTIAEGVETSEQAEHLTQIGVDWFQGYLYGAPMPAAELAKQFQLA